jgi:hypothetical protein
VGKFQFDNFELIVETPLSLESFVIPAAVLSSHYHSQSQSRTMSTQSTSAASQLLKLAVPLVTKNGFRTSTLIQASKQLPGAPTTGYTLQTINALYPSPPPANSRSASLFGSSKSLSRSQIIAEAQGRLTQEERVGPAKALLEAWLLEGRRQMVSHVHSSGLRGEAAIREGLRDRLSYNAPVLDNLVEVGIQMLSRNLGEALADVPVSQSSSGPRPSRRSGRLGLVRAIYSATILIAWGTPRARSSDRS